MLMVEMAKAVAVSAEAWTLAQSTVVHAAVQALAWTPEDARILAGLRDGRVLVVAPGGEVELSLNLGSSVRSLAPHPTGDFFAAGTDDGRAVYASTSGEMIAPDAYRKISEALSEIIRSLSTKSDACVAQIE